MLSSMAVPWLLFAEAWGDVVCLSDTCVTTINFVGKPAIDEYNCWLWFAF